MSHGKVRYSDKKIFSQPKTSSSSSPKSSKSSSSSSLSSSSSPSAHRRSKQECCQNGGVCVMGVFCHCPKNFFGFHCEYEKKPCGPIEHDSWARVGCNLCRCHNSKLLCLPQVYDGCDNKPVNEDIKWSDYSDEIFVFPPDKTTVSSIYEDYYYEEEKSKDDHSLSYSYHSQSNLLVISFLFLLSLLLNTTSLC